MSETDIYKAGAVIIKERKLLVSRSAGKDVFVAPGGKLEGEEDEIDALSRELKEEQNIIISRESVTQLGSFEAVAAGYAQQRKVHMGVWVVGSFDGELTPSSEIEENAWVDSKTDLPLGSIFEHDVIPELVKRGLID